MERQHQMIMNTSPGKIKQAVSTNKNTVSAVEELIAQLMPCDEDTFLCFSGPNHSPATLESAFQSLPAHTQFIACRTAGEITPSGYLYNSLAGVVLPSDGFTSEIMVLSDIDQLSVAQISDLTNKACLRLAGKVGREYKNSHCFAMMLIDGLSQKEEIVAAGINNGLEGIPLFGGSSADDVNYENAWIYCQGEMKNNVTALLIVHTNRPFKVFKTEHITCKDEVYVTTKVNVDERQVLEIDGYLASQWYANTIGVNLSEMTNDIFAKNPVAVKSGGHTYVRSIQSISDDGALCFYCAIEEGILLHLGQPNDLYDNINNALNKISQDMNGLEVVIGFDCTLRKLEAKQDGLIADLGQLFIKHNVIGFSTFGEQYGGIHINQTFTGLAIGKA